MNCPTWPWHGSGPFVEQGCYACLKRRVPDGEPASDEVRRFVGVGIPVPSGRGWRPVEASPLDRLAMMERIARHRLGDGGLALLRALERLGEEEPA